MVVFCYQISTRKALGLGVTKLPVQVPLGAVPTKRADTALLASVNSGANQGHNNKARRCGCVLLGD